MFLFDGHEYDLGAPAPTVAAAVSGGPDSMALCFLLSQWAQKENIRVHALTVDHGLRPEAAEEAALVGVWVAGWPHVRHEILKLDMTADSRVMERAREKRYDALTAFCRERKIERLFVAHHQDDQAETFLFRLAKGSGLDGLAAMRRESVKSGLHIIRPFLDLPKEALVALCEKNEVPFVKDPSNGDTKYARPRLRQARAVLEEEGLTPKRLAVTAARLSRARDALDFYADRAFENSLKEKTKDRIVLDFDSLTSEPPETRLRVVMTAMETVAPDEDGYGPRMEKLEALAESLFAAAPFRKQTLGGCVFSRGNTVVVEREKS